MKLLIVILNYKVTDLTIACLRSLSPEIASVPGAHVAVLENGTGGDAYERLASAIAENGWGFWVTLTKVDINLGFTGGNNIVIRHALARDDAPDFVMLLNADTRVQPAAVRHLLTFMEANPETGIAGSLLLSPENEVQASAFRFPSVASEFDRGMRLGIVSRLLSRWALVLSPPKENTKVDWVSGASMILRSKMLREIGLLDEGLFTYFDDVDICLRARRGGWSTWCVPESRVVHYEGASTGVNRRVVKRLPSYWFEARRRFLLSNYGLIRVAIMDAAFALGLATWSGRRIIQRKTDPDIPHLLLDHLRHSVFCRGFSIPKVDNPALLDR